MPTKITVNASYGGEVYIGSIKKVLNSGQSVIVDDAAAQADDIKKLVSKKIVQISSPDEPEQSHDKMALNPNEKFKVKNLSGRNLSVQGINEMMVPNGAIFINYETLLSGFIGVLIKSGMAEVSDVNGNKVVLDETNGFKKVSPEEEKEEEVELPEVAEVQVEDVELHDRALEPEEIKEAYEAKISLKNAADVKAQTGNQEADELMTKDEFGETVIDPLLKDKEDKTSYVWDFEAKSAKEGKPVFEYEGDNVIPDDGSAFVMPNKKLSIKSKNDVADALNPNKPKRQSIKKTASDEEAPVAKKKTTKKKTAKKKTTKKTTKKKTKKKGAKKTSQRRKVSQKNGIDKVVDKIKKKKLSIKTVGQEKKEIPAENIADDEVVIHSKDESVFVDQTQEAERIAKHPILRNRNNEDIE